MGTAVHELTDAVGHAGAVHPFTRLSRALVFHPKATRQHATPPDYTMARDEVVLRGWVVNPGADRALIYFGGNAEDTSARQSALRETLPGRTTYLLAYRGYGASDGRPSEQDLVADGIALFTEVAHHHARVAILGRSLGSAVATQVSSAPSVRDRVDKVILVTLFDSADSVARSHSPWCLRVQKILAEQGYWPAVHQFLEGA